MKIPKTILTTLEGLLWAAVGGATTSVLEIPQYMTNWKEFDIDYAHVARLAGAGAVLGAAMFLRELAQRQNVATANATANAALSAVGLPAVAGQVVPPVAGPGVPPQQPG